MELAAKRSPRYRTICVQVLIFVIILTGARTLYLRRQPERMGIVKTWTGSYAIRNGRLYQLWDLQRGVAPLP